MDGRILKEVIIQQKKLLLKKTFIDREKLNLQYLENIVTVISGIRRCGKSTLLQQIRNQQVEKDYFISFDDERLIHFNVDDFQLLYETFIELYGQQKTFYFDEIQNINSWERFVRRLHDYGNKIFITGSNASMLSKELGTHLTGRYIQTELFPFSFKEFLSFKKIEINEETIYTTEGKALLKRNYFIYLNLGGFPEYITENKDQYLKTLYENILYRDILVRNNLLNEQELKELVYFIAGNIAKTFTYSSLAKIINVKHTETVKQYLSHLENSYIIFIVKKYDYSIKKQLSSPKKVYFIDNALANVVGFSFSDNKGRFLENTVFLQLKRNGNEIFYHENIKECDFLIQSNGKICAAIQVSISLDTEQTEKREIEGLYEALKMYNLEKGTIITEDQEKTFRYLDKEIEVIPIWKWLLQ